MLLYLYISIYQQQFNFNQIDKQRGEKIKIEIKVIGPGCANCKRLLEVTKQAVKEIGLETDVEYITDIQKMVEMGIMQTPALSVNGKVIFSGFVPDLKTIKNKICK